MITLQLIFSCPKPIQPCSPILRKAEIETLEEKRKRKSWDQNDRNQTVNKRCSKSVLQRNVRNSNSWKNRVFWWTNLFINMQKGKPFIQLRFDYFNLWHRPHKNEDKWQWFSTWHEKLWGRIYMSIGLVT